MAEFNSKRALTGAMVGCIGCFLGCAPLTPPPGQSPGTGGTGGTVPASTTTTTMDPSVTVSTGETPASLPAPDLNRDILVGDGCSSVDTLSWRAGSGRSIVLEGTAITATKPAGWSVSFPRHDVAVLSGPSVDGQPRPTIELINAPACRTYDSTQVHRRLAIRSTAGLFGAGEAAQAFDAKKGWSGRLAPPGTSVISGGDLSAGGNTASLVTYYTEIGGGSNLVVVFAAACGGTMRGDSDCQRAYHAVVDTVVL